MVFIVLSFFDSVPLVTADSDSHRGYVTLTVCLRWYLLFSLFLTPCIQLVLLVLILMIFFVRIQHQKVRSSINFGCIVGVRIFGMHAQSIRYYGGCCY